MQSSSAGLLVGIEVLDFCRVIRRAGPAADYATLMRPTALANWSKAEVSRPTIRAESVENDP
jgi:hypothetical protein